MHLNQASIEWAIDFNINHSDGDLFPKIQELEALASYKTEFAELVISKEAESLPKGVCRRFLVPKDEISYRQASQLDPQDSVILSSIIYQYGNGIESRRLGKDRVFSYRFNPSIEHGLFDKNPTWNMFWQEARQLSQNYSYILYCDIADFYNQIYHHVVENQLIQSGFPNQETKWIVSLLESTTAGVSRGVPIGPHPIHLIAEATLIPIDNSLNSNGILFIRYVDDIIVFCKNYREATSTIRKIATILDKQQRLILQRNKTKIYNRDEFLDFCENMIQDRPISSDETNLLSIINKYTGGNPYQSISFEQISKDDWNSISEETIGNVISEYLHQQEADYNRLRWFYRRLTQIGHPGAINITLENIRNLGPCFANICAYFSSVQSIKHEDWKTIGSRLLDLLELDEVKENEYYRLSILSLFSRNNYINHFSILAGLFQSSDPFMRREILLSAKVNEAFDWIREYKENFPAMDPWQKIAFLYCVEGLPTDEKKYFINQFTFTRPLETILAKWSKTV